MTWHQNADTVQVGLHGHSTGLADQTCWGSYHSSPSGERTAFRQLFTGILPM